MSGVCRERLGGVGKADIQSALHRDPEVAVRYAAYGVVVWTLC